MRFSDSGIHGAAIVEIEAHEDERGFFARTWCANEFQAAGLPKRFVQASLSRNVRKGTLRGMHFQLPPSREGKLVRCTRGSILDVIVDIRGDSSSFLQNFAVELTAENARALFIPPGCAHGFLTLRDDTDVFYQMTDHFAPGLGTGIRWNDPTLAIKWPAESPIINARDESYDDLDLDWLRSLKWQ